MSPPAKIPGCPVIMLASTFTTPSATSRSGTPSSSDRSASCPSASTSESDSSCSSSPVGWGKPVSSSSMRSSVSVPSSPALLIVESHFITTPSSSASCSSNCPMIQRRIPGAPQINAAPLAAANGRLLTAAAHAAITSSLCITVGFCTAVTNKETLCSHGVTSYPLPQLASSAPPFSPRLSPFGSRPPPHRTNRHSPLFNPAHHRRYERLDTPHKPLHRPLTPLN